MGCRSTREQLEARRATLLAELDSTDERLRLAARHLESRRRKRWGLLGGLWSRLTTRAPRPVRLGADDGSDASLERDVDVLARALVLRWFELSERRGRGQRYDEELAARVARSDGSRAGEMEPPTNPYAGRFADAVIGGGVLLVLCAGGGALWWWLG